MARRKKKTPTIDGAVGAGTEPAPDANQVNPTDEQIVTALNSYLFEAKQVREGGLNPRDNKWKKNLDLYWNRYDFSKKASWQSRETLPEVPAFVDRFAAAMTEALVSSPEGFYTIQDPADKEGDLTKSIKKLTDAWLSNCGRNQNGYTLDFLSVFEEQVKMGALMACAGVVTWKEDVPGGRVAVEAVDPRNVWLDHTYRNLYRVRRLEIDRHDLAAMAKEKDSSGQPLFNLPQIDSLVSSLTTDMDQRKQELTGAGDGQAAKSSRQPIVIDEYIATVLGPDGKPIIERGLYMVANEQHLIRGPEDNPFWHQRDWLIYAPLMNFPLSVYGRSYMEDFGDIAVTFNELTNMILDAVQTTSLKAFAMVPGALLDPSQVNTGISPNKAFLLEDGMDPKQFAVALDLGTLPSESLTMWQSLKNELREASGMSEVAMGQFAPNSRTSAQEVDQVQKAGSSLIRSIASSLEARFLDPMLDLVWKTGIQHCSATDPILANVAGEEMYGSLMTSRKELASRPLTFQAHGISSLLERARVFKALIQLLQIIGSNELMLQQFLQKCDMGKLLDWMFELSGVNMDRITLTEREKMMQSIANPLNAAAQGAPGQAPTGKKTEAAGGSGPGSGAQREMASLTAQMGVSK